MRWRKRREVSEGVYERSMIQAVGSEGGLCGVVDSQ